MFLGSVGTALSAGLLGRRALADEDPVVVRVWFSERAAEVEGLRTRVQGYLTAALEPVIGAVDVQIDSDPVPLPRESGRRLLSRRWPRLVLEGAGGMRNIDPVSGVNLLVTDGDPTNHPAGFARPHVAATTGASAIARMPPPDEAPTVVPYSTPAAATQLLLHECGHALGLTHGHGSAEETDDGVVVSPMVSGYVWAEESIREKHLDGPTNACGSEYAMGEAAGQRYVRLRFADCATESVDR